ncbi:MAG TPA: hypothetical protein VGG71_02115 [Chitinophagaceae bacterium]
MEKLRRILTPLLTLILISAHATTYYFSTTDGDDNRSSTEAQNSATPWKTIDKLNSFFGSLRPGDQVLFKKGDVFYGTITPTVPGAAELPITLGAYGAGTAKPVITGFVTINSWRAIGNGIYEGVISNGPGMMNMVTTNGKFQPIGRWPKFADHNSGYLKYQSHNGATSITSDAIVSAPNFVGGEVVIRANHYNINRGTITSQTSNTVTYVNLPNSGAINEPKDNYGFFFQNHVNACTILGEWAYSNGSLKMYFGDKPPDSYVVQGSVLDSVALVNSTSYITFDNLAFTGGNYSAIKIVNSHDIGFNNCEISYAGRNGIAVSNSVASLEIAPPKDANVLSAYATGTTNITITNSFFTWVNNNGIDANYSTGWVLKNNTFKDMAVTPGMGVGGDQQYFVGSYIGGNSFIAYNTIDGCGYVGFHWGGDNCMIEYNDIQNFCLIKDDGGAIYSYKILATVPDTIRYNIVMNGRGAGNGTQDSIVSGGVLGIYNDGWNSNIHTLYNSVAYVQQAGILLNNPVSETVSGNTIYAIGELYHGNQDAGTGGFIVNEYAQTTNTYVRNLSVTNNTIVAISNGLKTTRFSTANDDIPSFGTFDHNIYARPTDQNDVIVTRTTSPSHKTIQQWQDYSKQDMHSVGAPRSVTSSDSLRFEFNATPQPVRISLGHQYIDMNDTLYNGFITLAPYTSAILMYVGELSPTPIPPYPCSPKIMRVKIKKIKFSVTECEDCLTPPAQQQASNGKSKKKK